MCSLVVLDGIKLNCSACFTWRSSIYVKRVKKFVNYAIDVTSQDKKTIKLQMDNAFEDLKRKNYRAVYQERYMFALIVLYVSQRYCGHVFTLLLSVDLLCAVYHYVAMHDVLVDTTYSCQR